MVFFRVGYSEGGQAAQGQEAQKHWCFQAFFVPLKGSSCVASQGEKSEKYCLENTVWNPYGNAFNAIGDEIITFLRRYKLL